MITRMERILKPALEYDDYATLPDDGKVHEVIAGDLFVTPAPTPFHQRASKRLQRQLEAYFEGRGLGEVFNAPIDVILSRHDILQPDLVVVADPGLISERGIEGPPLLVVEVLSPSSVQRDRVVKLHRYATLGVPHYWILDADARHIACYRADQGTYVEVATAGGDDTLAHPAWPDLAVRLAEIWS
jgi:Uma2 family endonuclease